jgi:hypothetical protein
MAEEVTGGEGASLEGSGGEVGGSPSLQQEATPDGAASSRPDWLLEGHESAESQAQAYHKHHQQYGGHHEFYAQQGNWFSQRYYNDPTFRQWVDDYNAGKHNQPQEQPPAKQAPYDLKDPATVDKFMDEFVSNPDKLLELAEERAMARFEKQYGGDLKQLKHQQAMSEGRRVFEMHKATLQQMNQTPHGKHLLGLIQRGLNTEEAVAIYLSSKPQAPQSSPAEKNDEAVRDPQGRYQRTTGNGRRVGNAPAGRALNNDEILAETKAKHRV